MDFLEKTINAMEFHVIMTCVSTVSFSPLINGPPEGYILPERGLTLCDPLSLYLFILCINVVSLDEHINGR